MSPKREIDTVQQRSHVWLFGILALMGLFAWTAESRGELPTGQLDFIAVQLLLVLMLIDEVLDRLRDLEKRMK